MEACLEGLNAAQRSAVTSPASVIQVLAPPGSGKTKTLTARVAWLINHERLQPWNIIVCTFTRKAANEMRERIRYLVGEKVESKLIMGTFHSIARSFLFRYGQSIGLERNFGVADTQDTKAMIQRIIKRHKYAVDPARARARISKLKAQNKTAAQFSATLKKADEHEFACVYTEYEDTLHAQNLLDFDDLLLRCLELLRKHPECVSTIQAVLIDEYQDTNTVQYELMTLIAQKWKRITIVGDPDQSIYAFRAAELKNLERMTSDYPESVVVNLENNYRSSGCILKCAKAVIEQDESRPNKPLLATHCVGERPVLRHLETSTVEARWIVEEITRTRSLAAGLLTYSDYAILLRSGPLSLSIEKALGQVGIPYRMIGGRRFFDRAEIKIVLDYLRVIAQPDHNDALLRIINVPSRKIGDATLKGLIEEAETKQLTLWALIENIVKAKGRCHTKISNVAQKGLELFYDVIFSSHKRLLKAGDDGSSLLDLISFVLQKISYEPYLKKTYPDSWEDRWANVEELVAQACQLAEATTNEELPMVEGMEQRQDSPEDCLSRFLANVLLASDIASENGEQPDQVTICTIHAAKGLEWPVVFIPAVYDGSIPHSRADDTDEERRLLYVGMTRAQALLYLSCPYQLAEHQESTLSKFISPDNIQKLFGSHGPTITFPVVRDLAGILRRECPGQSTIETARDLLERSEDLRYPLQRSDLASRSDDDPRPLISERQYELAHPSKRRRVETPAAGIAAPVTMSTAKAFSVASTTMTKGGFTTASHYKVLQDAENARMLASVGQYNNVTTKVVRNERTNFESTTEYAIKRTGRQEVKKVAARAAPSKQAKKRPAGQGAITNFFAKPTNSTKSETVPDVSLPRNTATFVTNRFGSDVARALADISNTTAQTSHSRPLPAFSNRKVRSTPILGKPRRDESDTETDTARHVLFSSSPVKLESDASAQGEQRQEGEQENQCLSPTKSSVACTQKVTTGFRPASTLESIAKPITQVQPDTQRKNLGLRRDFKGWVVKNHHPRPQS